MSNNNYGINNMLDNNNANSNTNSTSNSNSGEYGINSGTSNNTNAGEYGINSNTTNTVNNQSQTSYNQAMQDAVREKAGKDMLYGALWFVGGLVATMADIGAIFWGAMVFGGIQFIGGLIKYNK